MNTSTKHNNNLDPIDKIIIEEGLRISSVYFNRGLDMMLAHCAQ